MFGFRRIVVVSLSQIRKATGYTVQAAPERFWALRNKENSQLSLEICCAILKFQCYALRAPLLNIIIITIFMTQSS